MTTVVRHRGSPNVIPSPYYDRCVTPSGDISHWSTYSRAAYTDSGNVVEAYDDLKDGHSAVTQYWPAGGAKRQLWNPKGVDTVSSGTITGAENSTWYIQACIGEWSSTARYRRVISCGVARKVLL